MFLTDSKLLAGGALTISSTPVLNKCLLSELMGKLIISQMNEHSVTSVVGDLCNAMHAHKRPHLEKL
jgi:hypothetical protein